MAEILVGGLRAVAVQITIPRVGAWVADVDLDAAQAVAGTVVLSIDGVERVGAVVRGAVSSASWRGRIVGGRGGLSRVLSAVALRGSTLDDVLAGVLRDAGEIGGSALDLVAPLWARIEAPASTLVSDVARAAGLPWRVQADGSVRVEADTWADFAPTGDVDVIDDWPERGVMLLGGDVLGIEPGRTLVLPGRAPVRVEQIEIRATPRELRATITAEGATSLGAVVDQVIRRALRRVDYLAFYPCRVVSQSGQLLDLIPDDTRLPSISGVSIRHGVPGLSVAVPTGTRVLLGFDGGDPSRPFAALWERGGTATQIAVNGSSTRAAREGDDVSRTSTFAAWLSAVTTAVNGLTLPGTIPVPPTVLGTISEGSDVVRIP
jgi:hypothetical protein